MLTFALALLALVVIAALVAWVVRLILRLALAIGVSGFVGLIAALVTPSDAPVEPVTAGGLAALFTFALFAAFRTRDRGVVQSPRSEWRLESGADAPSRCTPLRANDVDDPTLLSAKADDPWSMALRLAPHGRERILRAQAACAAIERQSEADEHDLALLDAATVIRRHLLALVEDCEELCRDATGTERRRYQEELIAALEQLGALSPQVSEERRARVKDSFRTRLAHIARAARAG